MRSNFVEQVKFRWIVLRHPRQAHRYIAALLRPGYLPWYASTAWLPVRQHWAPDVFTPVTLCGRLAGERSNGEIRTLIGRHCRTCRRRVKTIMRETKNEVLG